MDTILTVQAWAFKMSSPDAYAERAFDAGLAAAFAVASGALCHSLGPGAACWVVGKSGCEVVGAGFPIALRSSAIKMQMLGKPVELKSETRWSLHQQLRRMDTAGSMNRSLSKSGLIRSLLIRAVHPIPIAAATHSPTLRFN